MRLTIRWSPIRTVFSIEPLGITRACATPPSIRMKANITQNQDTISRQTRSPVTEARGFLPSGARFSISALTMSLHFELHQLSRIAAGVARRAKFSFRIFHGGAERAERQVPERIGTQELADFLDWLLRGNQLFAPWRVHSIIAGRNRRRATDADVHFRGARFAHHADDFAAGGPAHDRIVHQNHALSLQHSTHRIQF